MNKHPVGAPARLPSRKATSEPVSTFVDTTDDETDNQPADADDDTVNASMAARLATTDDDDVSASLDGALAAMGITTPESQPSAGRVSTDVDNWAVPGMSTTTADTVTPIWDKDDDEPGDALPTGGGLPIVPNRTTLPAHTPIPQRMAASPAATGLLERTPPPPSPTSPPAGGVVSGTVPTKRKKKKVLPSAKKALKLTGRDRLILQFLTRYRYATYPQLAAYVGSSEMAMRQRLPRLRREGLVKARQTGPSKFLLWRPTDVGVKLSGLALPTPSIGWAHVQHTLGLVDLGVRFEAEGELVVTEREIRAADTRDVTTDRMAAARTQGTRNLPDAPLYAIGFGGGSGKYLHIPDMILVRAPLADGTPQSIAIELELTRKPPSEWKRLLTAYRQATNIGYVIYYTHEKSIRNGVDAAAKATDSAHLVEVRKYVPAESGLNFDPDVSDI